MTPDVAAAWEDAEKMMDAGVATLSQALLYQAEKYKGRVFHRHKKYGIWNCYNWEDVVAIVSEITAGLLSLGVQRSDTVAVIGDNEPELFWCMYAAHAAGAKTVCLYPDFTTEQIRYIIENSDARVIICQDQEQVDKALELERGAKVPRDIIYWDPKGMWRYDSATLHNLKALRKKGRDLLEADPKQFIRIVAEGSADEVVVLSYTSGTTGHPKACELTNGYLFDMALRIIGRLAPRKEIRYMSCLSPAWVSEQLFGVATGIIGPMTINFPERPESVQHDLREVGAEFLLFGPLQWEGYIKLISAKEMESGVVRRTMMRWATRIGTLTLPGNKGRGGFRSVLRWVAEELVLSHLRDNLGLQSVSIALTGGSGMSTDAFEIFHAMGVPLRTIYGSTEAGLLTIQRAENFDPESLGPWLPVHHKYGNQISYRLGDKGELLVKGGIIFNGYLKNKKATHDKMIDGWIRTGDAVRISDAGEPIFLERLEDLRCLAGGVTYPPSYIENRLRFVPYIKAAMTIGDERHAFVSLFVNIDLITLEKWAEKNAIKYTSFAELSQNEAVRELIRKEIWQINKVLPPETQIKRFINLPKELDPDENEITRSMKIRREFVLEKYASFVDAIYSGTNGFDARIPIVYQSGALGELKTYVHVNTVEPTPVEVEAAVQEG